MRKKATSKKSGKNSSAKKTSAKMNKEDIIQLILQDHKPLKKLIKVLKGEAEFEEKQEAYAEFAPALIVHAKAEEKSLYVNMKEHDELRSEAFEGDTEHTIADQLVNELKNTEDEDVWMAKVKVLAELVEHHVEEEEEEMLPDYKKESEAEERAEVGQQYLQFKEQLQGEMEEEKPSRKNQRSDQKQESSRMS